MLGSDGNPNIRPPGEVEKAWDESRVFQSVVDDEADGVTRSKSEPPVLVKALERMQQEVDEILDRQRGEMRSQLRAFMIGLSASLGGGLSVSEPNPKNARLRHLQDAPDLVNGDYDDNDGKGKTFPMEEDDLELQPQLPSALACHDDKGTWDGVGHSPRPRFSMDSHEAAAHQTNLRDVALNSKKSKAALESTLALALKARKGNDWQSKLLRLTGHWAYEVANAVIIFSNALLIAWESQHSAEQVRRNEPRGAIHFDVLMYLFCVIFAADLAVRILAQGAKFFSSLDWKWNFFDVVVVGGSVMEIGASLQDTENSFLSNASVLRVVRLVRVARIVRALRSVVYFRDLRITISMLCESIVPLMTFAMIMAMVFMVFGIFFTDAATGYIETNGHNELLAKYYGSLFLSMTTLYKSICGGMDWENALTPLEILPGVYVAIFYLYVTFAIFAMLNVVSAVFIDNTLQKSKGDRDFIVHQETQGKAHFLTTMEKLFYELDPDRSGTIRLSELQAKVSDPKVYAYFRAIDLSTTKVRRLFQLMDLDNSGEVDQSEFMVGCSKLCGEAKELDVAILQYEIKLLSNDVLSIKDLVMQICKGLGNT